MRTSEIEIIQKDISDYRQLVKEIIKLLIVLEMRMELSEDHLSREIEKNKSEATK